MRPPIKYTAVVDDVELIESDADLLTKPVQPDPPKKERNYQFAAVCRAWNSSKYRPHSGLKQFRKACNKWANSMPDDKIEESFRWLDTDDLIPERKLIAQELLLSKLNLSLAASGESHRTVIGLCKHCGCLNATIKIHRLKSSTIKEDAGMCCESCLETYLEERGQTNDDN